MKRYLLTLLLLVTVPSLAQNVWPEPYIIGEDFDQYIDLPEENWQYISTVGDSIGFQEVVLPRYTRQFEQIRSNLSTIDEQVYVWVRYRIKNTSKNPQIITFSIRHNKEDVYIHKGKNKWQHLVGGEMVPWSKRNGIKQLSHIPYTLQSGEEIKVYVNMGDITFFNNPNPRIGNFHKIVDENFVRQRSFTTDDVISFGFFGFIIFAVFFNMFFYYVNREKVYLVYSCLLFFSALLLAENVFLSTVFNEYRTAYPFFIAAVITLFIIMLIHTIRFFFRINIHFPGWDKFLIYFTVFIGISGTGIFLALHYKWMIVLIVFIVITTLAALIFIVAAIILIISLMRKKDKEARLFVIAAMPFILSPFINIILPFEWVITTCGMWTILVLSWGMFARFKSLQVANARAALEKEEERTRLIAEQNEQLEQQVADRTVELTKSLNELKLTQNQLIQSEKMASLGELTAGIAHEIQNPLNFVNNFSDVSIELLDEMNQELDKGDTGEVKAIAEDIKQNLQKIAHHGRRADGIVKGMLQHSRTSSGQKEPTDINALADEYFRLAYHGLRAKDKSFNAELITHFDPALPKAAVIPQDMGRVLLNLFTNAFYATQEKKKQSQSQFADGAFKPTVTVTTAHIGNTVEITVKDNGTGIPDAIKDKILQPFFTTKPTGEGTGLGLSLSYDIVVKGHGGTIAIDSKEGEGSEFKIALQVT